MKNSNNYNKEITRKEAIRKIGNYSKYAAFTAIGTYMILSPKKAQAESNNTPDPLDGDAF